MNAHFQKVILLLAATLVALTVVNCGGGGTYSPTINGQSAPPVVGITVAPTTATTTVGGTIQFTATVTGTNNTGVTWTFSEIDTIAHPKVSKPVASGGISNTGLFTAPNSAGTYTITATSQADTTKFATATATVNPVVVTVTVVPNPATVNALTPFQYSAVVTGTTNHNVTWTVVNNQSDSNSTATISSTGVFVSNWFSSGSYTVTATSVAYPTVSGTGQMTVNGGSNIVITATPAKVNCLTGQQVQCSATVTGNANTSVFWQIQPANVGTITQNGLYTAPGSPGTTTIYVTSQVDPTKYVAIPVTVNNG